MTMSWRHGFRTLAVSALVISMAGAASTNEPLPGRSGPQTPSSASLTPGSVALLADRLDDAGLSVLRSALWTGDATIRAVAARVAGIERRVDLIPALTEALSRETDPDAAAEQVRSLLMLGGPGAIATI